MRIVTIAFFIIVNKSAILFSQVYPQWGDLKPGNYNVGFKIVEQYDNRRLSIPKINFEGKVNDAEDRRPIQIAMWYPAKPVQKERMKYEEYFFAFSKPDQTRKNEIRKNISINFKATAQSVYNLILEDSDADAIAQTLTSVVHNAPNVEGKFPVIMSAQQGDPEQLSLLYEYLASKGYVVFVLPIVPEAGLPRVTQTQINVNKRVGDLEYLAEFVRTIAFADSRSIGLMGVNSESVPVLLFQMKNMNADAIVSLDGWDGYGLSGLLTESVEFEREKMRIPYMRIQSDWLNFGAGTPGNLRVFDSLFTYSKRYQYMIKNINHRALIGNGSVLPQLPKEHKAAYNFLYSTIANFFDAYLKKSLDGISFLRKSGAENGFSQEMILAEDKLDPWPAIPTSSELNQLLGTAQYEKVIKVFTEAKQKNSLLSAHGAIINNHGYLLLRRNKQKEAIDMFELNVLLNPENTGWLDSAAEAYEKVGDKQKMKDTSMRILEILSRKTILTDSEKSIKDTAQKRMSL